MRSIFILPLLLTAAAAMPAEAQERRARVEVERDGARGRAAPRVLQMTRSPRAVLGVVTTSSRGLQDTLGVLVTGVTPGSPAAVAGIGEGARLQAIDDVSLRVSASDAADPVVGNLGTRRLTRHLGNKSPGDEVRLHVFENGQARTVQVTLADAASLAPARAARARGRAGELRAARANRPSLGIQVGTSGSRRDTLGVFVMRADDDGPAAKAGIIEGVRIAAINGQDLRIPAVDAADPLVARSRVQRLTRALGELTPGDEVELRVWQNGQYRNVRVRTVPADSLRRGRSTFFIGDGVRIEPMPAMPSEIRIPRGADMGAFQFRMSPEFHREVEVILDGAVRGARTALEEVAHELPAVVRQYH